MLFKKILTHVAVIFVAILIAGVILKNTGYNTNPSYQKIADNEDYAVIPSDWKTYSNPEVGIKFRYPADFIIGQERHVPATEGSLFPYEIGLHLISGRDMSFTVGMFATGFESSKAQTEIRPKVITTLSGHTMTRTVYTLSPGEYHIMARGENTPWFVTNPFPAEQVHSMLATYDVILASFELKGRPISPGITTSPLPPMEVSPSPLASNTSDWETSTNPNDNYSIQHPSVRMALEAFYEFEKTTAGCTKITLDEGFIMIHNQSAASICHTKDLLIEDATQVKQQLTIEGKSYTVPGVSVRNPRDSDFNFYQFTVGENMITFGVVATHGKLSEEQIKTQLDTLIRIVESYTATK